ncbi:MAG: DUF192 domain-containing protein [Patescibacteria group bacterium]
MPLGTKNKVFLVIGVIVMACFMVLFAYQQRTKDEVNAMPQREITLAGVTLRTWVATTATQQRQGLAGRASLDATAAMLFPYDRPAVRYFWMQGMNFPIDIIWIKNGVVVGWQKNVPPPTPEQLQPVRMVSPQPVDTVLEVAAGFVSRSGLVVGDPVSGLTDN